MGTSLMFAICMLTLTLNASVGIEQKDVDIEGRILKTENGKYIMDFTQGALSYPIKGGIEPYKHFSIETAKCIKE